MKLHTKHERDRKWLFNSENKSENSRPNSINGREALLFNIQDFCVNTHYDPYKKLIMNEILMKYG